MNKLHLRYKKQTPRERTWTIHFISLEKTVKGIILVIVGFRLLTLFNRDVHAWAEDFITRHGIDLANRYVQSGLERLTGIGNRQLVMFSAGAFIYAGLLFTEGIGLWLQKRWAEYMTTYLTALFIPVELYELYERFTWVRVGILGLNIFVVWYLSTRLRDEKKEEKAAHAAENSPVRIKICGITDLEDALLSISLGAEDLGFNFYQKSPRYISPENAAAIISELPKDVSKVGVFVNESVQKINDIASIAGLDAIQLHGDEDERFIAELHDLLGLPIIKAVKVTSDIDPDTVERFGADAILLDKYSAIQPGGTGETIDWKLAKRIASRFKDVYLAGGLSAENVAEAIREVRPYGVDVCSQIESEPGKKDEDKLKRFIAAVRETL